jgi:hypothetical protein
VAQRFRRELGLVVGWLVFPLVPVILEDFYYQICNLNFESTAGSGPDPRTWGWGLWIVMLGPLLGYGFLAGATVDVPDDLPPSSRRLRRLFSQRAVWVAVGPWCGFLFWCGVYFGLVALASLSPSNWQPQQTPIMQSIQAQETWASKALGWIMLVIFVGVLSYGWLWPARAALRRASLIGRLRWVLYRGLLTAAAFVGSLFGSFWAATSVWRSYFFDPRVVPLVALAVGLLVIGGCGAPLTYGEVRRRELFHAMLVAWMIGLALMWRWWSRPRPGPPRNDVPSD